MLYHNHVCDILAMYGQECAINSGESTMASAAAVYNEIAAARAGLDQGSDRPHLNIR